MPSCAFSIFVCEHCDLTSARRLQIWSRSRFDFGFIRDWLETI